MLLLSSAGESFFQLIVVLVIFIVVLLMTYYVTKWLAGYQKAQQFNRNLEIIETIKLTSNKYVQIVRAGENHYFVLALGKDEVTLLGELSSNDLLELSEADKSSNAAAIDFKSILEKFSKKNN